MHTNATEQPALTPRGSPTEPERSFTDRLSGARPPARTTEAVVFGLLCFGALSVFYYEVIFLNRTFLPLGYVEVMGRNVPWQFSGTSRENPYRADSGGSAWQLEPWAPIVAASYASGQVPLWNTHQFFGTPFAAAAQPGAFDILRLPALVTTHAWGWDLYYLSQSALCLVLTYVFTRSVAFRPEAAFLAAVAYSFSGFMFIRGNMHFAEIFHLLPGILWGTELVVQGALRRGMLVVAGTVALSLFAGMPEVTLLTFLYAASYGAFRTVWEAVGQGAWRFAVQRNVMLALAWAAGIGVGAPLVLPMLEYLGQSFNVHPPEREQGLLFLPIRALAYIGVPYIEGLPLTPAVPGGTIPPLDDYSGAAVVLLAIVGSLSFWRLGRPSSAATFALTSAILWGAKLFGVPGINEIGRLPLLAQDVIVLWGTPMLSFSLALLAGAGIHALISGQLGLRTAIVAGLCFLGYLAGAAALTWPTLQAANREHTLSTLGLALGAGLAVWVCLIAGKTRWRTVAAVGAGLVTIGELVILAPHDVYSDRYDSLARPPFVNWLQQQQASVEPFRVFSADGLLFPDFAGAYGLDDVRAVDALYPRRTWDFVQTFLSPSITDRYVGGFGNPELPTELFDNKWLNLSNVRYILRPADQSPSFATLAQSIVDANYPPTEAVHVSEFTIDGQRREVLIEWTQGEVVFHLRPDAAQPGLTFFAGIDPHTTSAAQFYAIIQSNGQRKTFFDKELDARTDSGRHWVPGQIDLTPYIGQQIDLVLQTESRGGAISSPGWGDLRLAPVRESHQFTQVYAGERSIWENSQSAPRAFLVGNVQRAATSADAVAQMQAPGFDPSTSAVVEAASSVDFPAEASAPKPAGSVRVFEYRQEQVQLSVDAQRPSLLVLTDSYYPGWAATLDGAPTPIFATDLAFRGVLVPAGSHQVTFSYLPASFLVGVAIASAALVLLGFAVWRLPLLWPR